MRTTSEPASHRCVLGVNRRWRRGSIVATLTRPASLHYSVVVQERRTVSVLLDRRRNQTFSSLMVPAPTMKPDGFGFADMHRPIDRHHDSASRRRSSPRRPR